MADDTGSEDNFGPLLADLAKYGIGAAGTIGANETMQSAYRAILKNLQDRFGDYKNLTPAQFKSLVAQQLGPSALSQIAPDAQAREAQQAQLAQLDEISRSGGLTLADKAALNEIEQTLSRNNAARNNSIANQFAARGQLGAGEQLATQLSGAEQAGEQANKRGESIAADAQKRAMQAVLEKGTAARAMSNDDYQRKKAAAEAADSIALHNAQFATDADKYNNMLKEQQFDEGLKKLAGETGLTTSMNQALLGQGQQSANTQAGLAYGGTGLVNSLSRLGGGRRGGGGGGGGGDSGGDTRSAQTNDSDPNNGSTGDANGSGGGDDTGDTRSAADTDLGGGDAGGGDPWSSLTDTDIPEE